MRTQENPTFCGLNLLPRATVRIRNNPWEVSNAKLLQIRKSKLELS